MPAVLMHSLFPKFVLTPKFFQCVFTVKNVHCTQYLDPICALPTGKQDRLERLRRQKTKSESYLKPYHNGCNQQTPFFTSLFFYADWKKIYSLNISQVCRTNGPTNLFNCITETYFHYTGTLQARTEGACMSENSV